MGWISQRGLDDGHGSPHAALDDLCSGVSKEGVATLLLSVTNGKNRYFAAIYERWRTGLQRTAILRADYRYEPGARDAYCFAYKIWPELIDPNDSPESIRNAVIQPRLF